MKAVLWGMNRLCFGYRRTRRSFGITELWHYGTTESWMGTQGYDGQQDNEWRLRWGYAGATPDYETTSQQDNEGFAALRQTTTSTCSL